MPGTISLGCNLGVLANVRINRPSNNLIRGSAFIGNSTLNTNHPKLAHGNFEFSNGNFNFSNSKEGEQV